ncbi:nuclear mitotic apparatus protein 1 isoform X2 [Erpetoichthys calabaricus]|uniref:nuclear mitotic apparatus protein 1 isoform X2 n=1 Tax=Erpetoichthys calabaricus TaxID=27687 RepID=UPI0022346D5A|nr:nuclear mitotic apparatus protein 1 isoform X2 [Erpetoichthys calabaricus]
MVVDEKRKLSLLTWINSLNITTPIEDFSKLQDGTFFVKLISKLKGAENEAWKILEQPVQGRLDFISDFLKSYCRYNTNMGALISWENIKNGENLDVELSKVVVLLLYHSHMCVMHQQEFEKLDYRVQAELASILRFVLDNEESLYLNDKLEYFLKSKVMLPLTSNSSSSTVSEEESPVFTRKRKVEVHFVDLHTVASSSASSPIQDVLKTPQFQVRKLQTQLAFERNMRDELELELAASSKIITEKETQLSLLQQRIQRLVKQHDQNEPKELEELREKNESLLKRLQDTIKQCHDMKTSRRQMERKIDQLTEENGDLSYKVRDLVARLNEAQHAVDKLSREQEDAMGQWKCTQTQLENDLSKAILTKECLEESILILQGKIVVLEDQLKKGDMEIQNKGEVMGDVLELENLKQEVRDLKNQLNHLQEVITQLEENKRKMLEEITVERVRFEEEKSQLSEALSKLEQAHSEICLEKKALEQASKEQYEIFLAQIDNLNSEIFKLNELAHQRELELQCINEKAEQERLKASCLKEEMEKRDQCAKETINGLSQKVDELGTALKRKEEELITSTQLWEMEKVEGARREDALQQMSTNSEKERNITLMEYKEFQKSKREEIAFLQNQILELEKNCSADKSLIAELEKEKLNLQQKVSNLEAAVQELTVKCQSLQTEGHNMRQSYVQEVESLTIRLYESENLLKENKEKLALHLELLNENKKLHDQINKLECATGAMGIELETERKKSEEVQLANLEKVSTMTRDFQQLEAKTQEISAELELVYLKLSKEKEEKKSVESNFNELLAESTKKTNALSSELKEAQCFVSEKNGEIQKLEVIIGSHEEQLKASQQSKQRELLEKDEEIKKVVEKLASVEKNFEEIKNSNAQEETSLKRSLEEHQIRLASISQELTNALVVMKQKDLEVENLKSKLLSNFEQLSNQQESNNQLQKEVDEIKLLRERLSQQENQMKTYKEHMQSAETQILQLQLTVSTKETEVKELLKKVDTEKERASAVQGLQQESILQVHSLQSTVQEQNESISKLEKELSDAKTLLKEKTNESAAQITKVENLCLELRQQKERMLGMEAQLQISESTQKAQESTIEKLQTETTESLDMHKLHENNLKEETARLKAELGNMKQEMDRISTNADAQSKEKEEIINKLKADVASAMSLASEKEQMVDLLKKDLLLQQNTNEENKNSLVKSHMDAIAILQSKIYYLECQIKEQNVKDNLRDLAIVKQESHCSDLTDTIQKLQPEVLELSCPSSERSHIPALLTIPHSDEEEKKCRDEIEALQKELETAKRLNQKLEADLSNQADELSSMREELTNAQALIGEIMPAKRQCHQLQAELCLVQSKTREELEKTERVKSFLEEDLQQVREELSHLLPVKDKVLTLELNVQKLQAENLAYKEQVSKLQLANKQLASESLEICSDSNQGVKRFDAEMAKIREAHGLELDNLKMEHLRQISAVKEENQEVRNKVDTLSAKYENAKLKVLEGRHKFQEERQKLIMQVDDLVKKVSEREAELKNARHKLKIQETEDVHTQRKQISDLQFQLNQKEQTVEHYKTQAEKAKVYYDAKKQQLQEMTEKMKSVEMSLESNHRENTELKTKTKQLEIELQQAQMNAKNLSMKVCSLEAQVEYADRQLRELGRSQLAMEPFKSRELSSSEKEGDVSKDSLECSLDEKDLWNSTRKPAMPMETPIPIRTSERIAQKQVSSKVPSLESLYFTPLPNRTESKLESSINSLEDLTLNSTRKTCSARRRTTQIINITLTKKEMTPGGEPGSANSSFYSLRSTKSQNTIHSKTDRRISSQYSMSQESLDELTTNEKLLGLPGYRPSTSSTTSNRDRLSTSSFLVGSQNEPEHTDDWMRIAELQARNQACLPHLKTSYPLESRPSIGIPFTISDEEVKLGDPTETIRRASLLPSQINKGVTSHRLSMLSSVVHEGVVTRSSANQPSSLLVNRSSPSQSNRVSTRQHLKRTCENSHKGPETPESKKIASCFPRPMTPKDKNDRRYTMANSQNVAPKAQDRRQSMSFSIINTPKKLGSSILQRGINKMRQSTRKSPNSSNNKTPRNAKFKSPKVPDTKSPKTSSTKKERPQRVSRISSSYRKGNNPNGHEKHEALRFLLEEDNAGN